MDQYQNRSPDENYKKLKSHLNNITDKYVPSKMSCSHFSPSWYNSTVKRMCNKKQRLYNKAKRSHKQKQKDWDAYNTHKKNTLKAIRKSCGTYIHGILQDSLDNNNTKPFWKFFKAQKQDNVVVPPMKVNGTLHTDSKDRANILNKQFKSVFTKNNQTVTPLLTGPRYPLIQPLTITVEAVEKLLSKIKVNKASGPDNIPCRILQELSAELAPMLTDFSTVYQLENYHQTG